MCRRSPPNVPQQHDCGSSLRPWPQRTTAMMKGVVREGGVEPPSPFGHTDLNRARLPIPPLARAPGGPRKATTGRGAPRIAADGWSERPSLRDTIGRTSCRTRRRPGHLPDAPRRCGGHPRPLRAAPGPDGQRRLRPRLQGRGAAGRDRQRSCSASATTAPPSSAGAAPSCPTPSPSTSPRATSNGSTVYREALSPRARRRRARARRRAGLRASSARSTVDIDAGRRPRDRALPRPRGGRPGEIPAGHPPARGLARRRGSTGAPDPGRQYHRTRHRGRRPDHRPRRLATPRHAPAATHAERRRPRLDQRHRGRRRAGRAVRPRRRVDHHRRHAPASSSGPGRADVRAHPHRPAPGLPGAAVDLRPHRGRRHALRPLRPRVSRGRTPKSAARPKAAAAEAGQDRKRSRKRHGTHAHGRRGLARRHVGHAREPHPSPSAGRRTAPSSSTTTTRPTTTRASRRTSGAG